MGPSTWFIILYIFFSLFVLSSVCIDIYAGESAGKEKKQKENAIMYDGD